MLHQLHTLHNVSGRIVDGELKVVMACFKVKSYHMPEETEEKYEKSHSEGNLRMH
jgi:hypothetical protein